MQTAKLIKSEYLNENGQWYNGKSIWAINMNYSRNENNDINYKWSDTINQIAYDLVKKANNF